MDANFLPADDFHPLGDRPNLIAGERSIAAPHLLFQDDRERVGSRA